MVEGARNVKTSRPPNKRGLSSTEVRQSTASMFEVGGDRHPGFAVRALGDEERLRSQKQTIAVHTSPNEKGAPRDMRSHGL